MRACSLLSLYPLLGARSPHGLPETARSSWVLGCLGASTLLLLLGASCLGRGHADPTAAAEIHSVFCVDMCLFQKHVPLGF